MSDWVKEALAKNIGVWVIAAIALLMVGPAGINRMFDRFFPPAETVAAEEVSDKVTVLQRSNRYQLDKLIDSFNALSADIKNMQTMIFLMHDRIDVHERMWADYLATRQSPEDQTLELRYPRLPPGTP